jgi:hypothetical protein
VCDAVGDPDYVCTIPGQDTCSDADPDLCAPQNEPDECAGAKDDKDYDCHAHEPDTCVSANPDLCSGPLFPDECAGVRAVDIEYDCPSPGSDRCTVTAAGAVVSPDLCRPGWDPDVVAQCEEEDVEFVPEPGTVGLLASGLMGLIGYGLMRRHQGKEDDAEDQ